MLVVAFIPGLVGISSTYLKGSRVFKRSMGLKFMEISRHMSLALKLRIENEGSEAELLAANPAIREFIESGRNNEVVSGLLAIENKEEGHLFTGLFDVAGKGLVNGGKDDFLKNLDPRTISQLDASPEPFFLGAPFRRGEKGFYVLPVYAAIRSNDGKDLTGALAIFIEINAAFFGKNFLSSGESGRVNVVGPDGTVLYDPRDSKIGGKLSPGIVEKVRDDDEAWFIETDDEGIESVMATSPPIYRFHKIMLRHESGNKPDDKFDKLYVLLTQPVDEAFIEPIREVLLGAAIPGFLFASLLILAIYMTLKRIVSPIAALKEGVSLIAAGNLDHSINIKSGDEIEDLAHEFNNMSRELKSLYTDLENKVRRRTLDLEISNRELEKANRLKSEFLANMSHELRTPLNSIIGFSEVLIDGLYGEINKKQEKYLNNILISGKHLLELINTILDLSKIEAGQMKLVYEAFDLREIVEAVESVMRQQAETKNIHLGLAIDEGASLIMADRLKFKQILYNLLGNAVKFTPRGGKVSLTVKREKDSILISVSDSGPGIREGEADLIFEAFRQSDGSHRRDFQGTGLGLTLSKKFVELHGGKISLTSEEGKGSTFTFTIPVKITG